MKPIIKRSSTELNNGDRESLVELPGADLTPLPLNLKYTLKKKRESLPTMYDLPSDYPDDPGLPDHFHLLQPQILQFTFRPPAWEEGRFFSASDLNVYYDEEHPGWYKRPDWLGVVDAPRIYGNPDGLRDSYVIWEEESIPFVAVELISKGTKGEDLGKTQAMVNRPPTKWLVYEQIIKVPYYIVFERKKKKKNERPKRELFKGFRLVGNKYEPLPLVEGRILIPELSLSLGKWLGNYEGFRRRWLRWMTLEGELILLPREEAQASEAREMQARLVAQASEAREMQARLEIQAIQERENQARLEAQAAQERENQARLEAQAAQERETQVRLEMERLKEMLRSQGIEPG